MLYLYYEIIFKHGYQNVWVIGLWDACLGWGYMNVEIYVLYVIYIKG